MNTPGSGFCHTFGLSAVEALLIRGLCSTIWWIGRSRAGAAMKSFTLPARYIQQCVHHKQQQKIMLIKLSSTMAEAEEQFTNKLLLLLKPFKLCAWSCDSLGITIAASPQMMATQDFNTVNVVTFSQHTCAAGCCNLTQRRLPLFLTLAKFPSRVGGCSRAVSGQCQVKQEGAANSWWIIIQSFSALCCWCRESNNWVHTLFQAKDCFFSVLLCQCLFRLCVYSTHQDCWAC